MSCVETLEPHPLPPCLNGIQVRVHEIFDKLEILRKTLICAFDISGKLWQYVSALSQDNHERNDHLVLQHLVGHRE